MLCSILRITKYVLFSSEHQKDPIIVINLSTLSYHFKLNKKDLICGYQLNKIKFELETFLAQLKHAGAQLEFVFKKTTPNDKDFLKRRLNDYHFSCDLLKKMSLNDDFEALTATPRLSDKFPYNTMILVSIVQSARKFGNVHGCNCIKGKPTVQQVEMAKEIGAAWIMGLDTYYFILPGKWKLWVDQKLDMTEMTIQQFDPKVVMQHLELKPRDTPLYGCLVGDLQSLQRNQRKVLDHFGRNLFVQAAKFLNELEATETEAKVEEVVTKIFGGHADPTINQDFLKTMQTYAIDHKSKAFVDMEVLDLVKNDFMSIAEEILTNQPIFINPSFLSMRSVDMKTINDLAIPLIEKTAGVLLKNFNDVETRSMVLLMNHDDVDFVHLPLEIIYPPFEVQPLRELLAGENSLATKMELLYWISDIRVKDTLIDIPEEYLVDCTILLYLIKNESLKLLDARCILKTLVDARRMTNPFEISTEYPEKVHERAFRCSFLYSKMYFFFHSCLSSLGMKHLCPDIQFDGVYFQKIYALNIKNEDADEGTEKTEQEMSQAMVIGELASLINM